MATFPFGCCWVCSDNSDEYPHCRKLNAEPVCWNRIACSHRSHTRFRWPSGNRARATSVGTMQNPAGGGAIAPAPDWRPTRTRNHIPMPASGDRKSLPGIRVLSLVAAIGLFTPPVASQSAPVFSHRSGTEVRRDGGPLAVARVGTGSVHVVAITGHSHGPEYFAALTERLGGAFTFHVVTPPGMDGTAAYPWPTNADDLRGEEWTTRFVADLLKYVTTTFVSERPLLLAGWDAALGQALRALALAPKRWRGAVLVGSSPYYQWYRSAETDAESDLALQRTQRLPGTMRFWGTVPESTWHRNTYPAWFYTADAALGQRLKAAERSRPFEIVLRYFAEFLHGDHVTPLRSLEVPVVAIATVNEWLPGAADRARAAWQVSNNSCVEVHLAPSERYMTWVDHPMFFDSLLIRAAERPACRPHPEAALRP